MKPRHLAAVPASLRRLNERLVVRLLHQRPAASRAEIAKAVGISQPTAGKIIDDLLRWEVIEELEPEAAAPVRDRAAGPRLGRPGRLLRLNHDIPRFWAIELGVEHTRLGCLPLAANGGDAWPMEFRTGGTQADWVRCLRRQTAALDLASLWGILVSVPGVVDERAARVLYSPNLHWTERCPLTALVQDICPLPVLLVQEIRALALGHLAANPGCDDFLLVDFGEGVGGAIIEGGQLASHPLPLSAELGHVPVPGNVRPCGCGATGCVETLLSRSGLLRTFAETSAGKMAGWPAMAEAIDRDGLPDWLASALNAMGTIIAAALNTLGLRRVVVTGCLNDLPAAVLERLRRAVIRDAMWARFGEVAVDAAPRRRMAGLVSAGIGRLLFPDTVNEPAMQVARGRMAGTARVTRRVRVGR